MLREKYRLTFFDTYVDVLEPTVEQYLKIFSWDQKVYKEIFWRKIFELNERQLKNALQILISKEKEEKNIFTEKKVSKNDENIGFEDFYILEWRVMHLLHQSRSEIRTWGIKYFFKVVENLDVIIWEKKFDDYKNADKPDKKSIKENLLNLK